MSETGAIRVREARLTALRWLTAVAAAALFALLAAGCGDDDASGESGATAPTTAFSITSGSEDEIRERAKALGCDYKNLKIEGSDHLDPETDFKYKSNPPTSGDHVEDPAADGAYLDDPPPIPNLVHSLEHGRIIVQWDPKKVTDDQIGTLEKLYNDEPTRLMLVPNETNMPYAIAATAWGHLIGCDEIKFPETYELIRVFHATWQDRGPENVPPMT